MKVDRLGLDAIEVASVPSTAPVEPQGARGRQEPQPNGSSLTERQANELQVQGPVTRALMVMAKDTPGELGEHFESLAWAFDRERRGPMSVAARSDPFEVLETIKELLRGELMSPGGRKALRERLRRLIAEPS